MSGQLTLNVAGACRSFVATNYTNTFTMSGQTLSIGTSTVNGTTALLLVAGMTLTKDATSLFSFVSTSTTQVGITTAGKVMPATTFNGTAGTWKFLDAFTATGAIITLTAGSLDTNAQAVNSLTFSSTGAGVTRSLTLGATTWTMTGTTSTTWDATTGTNLTLSAASSTLTFSGAGAGINGGSKAYGSITFTGSGTTDVTSVTSAVNVTRNGTAVKTERLRFTTAITISTLLTATGQSAINRLFIENGTTGSAGTTVTAAAVSLSNVDFARITGAGAASPFTGTSIGNSGTTSGITFTTAVTRFWVASGGTSTGNWSDTNHWAATSGGAGGQSVPIPQDTVRFDPSSIDAGSRTITGDMPRYGNSVDWTGATNSPTWNITAAVNASSGMTGDLTLIGAMTLSGSIQLVPSVSTAKITTNAATITAAINLQGHLAAKTTLQDNLTTTSTITLNDVELDTNGKAVSSSRFISSLAAHPRVVTLGATQWTLTGTGNVLDFTTVGSLTFTASTGTFIISDTSATTKTIASGGVNLNGGSISITGGGSGSVTLQGSNTIGTFTIGTPKTVILTASTTQAVTNFVALGTLANLILFKSGTPATAAIFRAAASNVSNVTATDINSSGGAGQPIIDLSGVNGGGNTNWTFPAGSTSITTAEAFGTGGKLIERLGVGASIPTAEAFGTPGNVLAVIPPGPSIPSAEAFGTGGLLTELISGGSILTAEAFGTPGTLTQIITGASIASAEAFGTPGNVLAVIPPGASIPSAEAFGTGGLLVFILPGTASILTAEAFGTPGALITVITGASIPSAEAFGVGKLTFIIRGNSSIPSGEAFGTGVFAGFSQPTSIVVTSPRYTFLVVTSPSYTLVLVGASAGSVGIGKVIPV